jgi:hypothetical protein
MPEVCPICQTPTEYNNRISSELVKIFCLRCGEYKITFEAQIWAKDIIEPQIKANISGWLSEHQQTTIDSNDIIDLQNLSTPLIGEKATKYFLFISKLHPKAGHRIKYNYDEIHRLCAKINNVMPDPNYIFNFNLAKVLLPHLSACWAVDEDELRYIIKVYLQNHKNYVNDFGNSEGWFITPEGWSFIES